MRLNLVWLIAFLSSQNVITAEECGSSDNLAISLSLRAGDVFANFVPGAGAFIPVFWALFDSMSSSNEIDCYVKKYLRGYHGDTVHSVLQLWVQRMKSNKNDRTKIEDLLKSFENPTNMVSVHSENSNTRAAIFPFILHWAAFHLGVYKELIDKFGKSTVKGRELKRKQIKQADFYTKKMLKYYRPYRDMVLDETPSWHIAMTLSTQKSAYEFVTRTAVRNVLEVQGGKFYELVQTCLIRSGDPVAFKRTEKRGYQSGWLSCYGSGSKCKHQSCPGKYMTFEDGKDGYRCRGEVFWIYADTNIIRHGSVVNIQYSSYSDKGYWLSYYPTYRLGNYFLPWTLITKDELNVGYITKTCPGRSFSSIRTERNWNCELENFKVDLHKCYFTDGNCVSGTKYPTDIVTDGTRIKLQVKEQKEYDHGFYEVFKQGSECSA